jgi:hypothetical protein
MPALARAGATGGDRFSLREPSVNPIWRGLSRAQAHWVTARLDMLLSETHVLDGQRAVTYDDVVVPTVRSKSMPLMVNVSGAR